MSKKDQKNNANGLVDIIREIFSQESNGKDSTAVCIVDSVNSDGTLNLFVLPDTQNVLRNIVNQCKFDFNPGDTALLYKIGNRTSNSFVIAKYNAVKINADDIVNDFSIPHFATLEYTFKDASTLNTVSVFWKIKTQFGEEIASGEGEILNAKLAYGKYNLTTEVTSEVYSYDGEINIDASKIDKTDTQTIEINHNNVGTNCEGEAVEVEYSGTSDATYVVHITSGATTFIPYKKDNGEEFTTGSLTPGKGIKLSLTFLPGMGYTENGVNEADKQKVKLSAQFYNPNLDVNMRLGLNYNGDIYGGTRQKYSFANITHNNFNNLAATYDIIYALDNNGRGVLLGKMSTDENYSIMSRTIAWTNTNYDLRLQIIGEGNLRFNYQYSNFEYIDNALEFISEANNRNVPNYKLTPMDESVTDFKMYYDIVNQTEQQTDGGYGAYIDKINNLSEGVIEVSFHAKNTVSAINPDAYTFVGFAMTDPATGNFLNIGFQWGINNFRYIRASLEVGNGYEFRYLINNTGNVDGQNDSTLPSVEDTIWLCRPFELDFKARIEKRGTSTIWRLFVSNDGGASWMRSGSIDIERWMREHQSEAQHSWYDGASDRYPTGNDVCFGVYVFDNERGIDISITDFYSKIGSPNYYITYNLNGGTNNENNPSSYITEDTPITLDAPIKIGYIFAGWSPSNIIPDGDSGDKTFTANWIPSPYTPYTVNHYKRNGATYNLVETDDLTGTTGTEVTAIPIVYTGFECITPLQDRSGIVAADGSLVINLYYDPLYVVTFNGGGGVLISGTEVQTVRYGNSAVAPTYTRTGYTFTGFDTPFNYVTSDITVTAQWLIIEYAINYILNGGTNNPNNPIKYTIENAVTLEAPTRDYYNFISWSDNGEIPLGSTGDKTFEASWSPISYNITYVLNGGTNAVGNPDNYTVESATITLADPTRTGYTFTGWEEGNTIPHGSHGDKTFTATWTPNTNTPYTVKHYKQNIQGNNNYTLVETQNLTGTTGTEVTAACNTYTNFFCVTSEAERTGIIAADGSLVINIYYNYWLMREARDTTSFSMPYNSSLGGYGKYIDNIQNIGDGTVQITFHASATGNATSSDPFIGFVMVDPATGNFMNVGFMQRINNYRDLRSSLSVGNGWAYRYPLPAAGNSGGSTNFPDQSNSQILTIPYELDFKAVVEGDLWQLFYSTDNGQNWLHSGYLNIKTWMQGHNSAGGFPWSGDAENIYPSSTDVLFGVYVFDNNGQNINISNFELSYLVPYDSVTGGYGLYPYDDSYDITTGTATITFNAKNKNGIYSSPYPEPFVGFAMRDSDGKLLNIGFDNRISNERYIRSALTEGAISYYRYNTIPISGNVPGTSSDIEATSYWLCYEWDIDFKAVVVGNEWTLYVKINSYKSSQGGTEEITTPTWRHTGTIDIKTWMQGHNTTAGRPWTGDAENKYPDTGNDMNFGFYVYNNGSGSNIMDIEITDFNIEYTPNSN